MWAFACVPQMFSLFPKYTDLGTAKQPCSHPLVPRQDCTWIKPLYLGEGNGNPLQYSCLENPTDRGAWQATVQRVPKSGTWQSDFTSTFFTLNLTELRYEYKNSVCLNRVPTLERKKYETQRNKRSFFSSNKWKVEKSIISCVAFFVSSDIYWRSKTEMPNGLWLCEMKWETMFYNSKYFL